MKYKIILSAIILFLFSQVTFSNALRVLKGIDVIGNTSLTKEEIIKDYPFKIGESVEILHSDDIIQTWCVNLKNSKELYQVYCSRMVFKGTNEAYAVISILERPEDAINIHLLTGRTCTDKVKLAALPLAYSREFKTELDRNREQNGSGIHLDNPKHLDFEDPTLHQLSLKFSKDLPKYKKHLYTVIRQSCDDDERARAVELLNWAGNPEQSIKDLYPFMRDPFVGVRNNITRLIVMFSMKVKDPTVQKAVLKASFEQLMSPELYDKNKALGLMLELADQNKELVKEITNNKIVFDYLHYLHQNSISPSIGAMAKQILDLTK